MISYIRSMNAKTISEWLNDDQLRTIMKWCEEGQENLPVPAGYIYALTLAGSKPKSITLVSYYMADDNYMIATAKNGADVADYHLDVFNIRIAQQGIEQIYLPLFKYTWELLDVAKEVEEKMVNA